MSITRQERERVVLDLYHNQGKNIRQIAQEARMSFRDIGAILSKSNEGREQNNNNNNDIRNKKRTSMIMIIWLNNSMYIMHFMHFVNQITRKKNCYLLDISSHVNW
jgi:hypothetical protein